MYGNVIFYWVFVYAEVAFSLVFDGFLMGCREENDGFPLVFEGFSGHGNVVFDGVSQRWAGGK